MYFILVLLIYFRDVYSCPLDCHCSTDVEYEDGVFVDCENLALDEIPYDIPSHVTTLLLNFNNLRSIEPLQYYTNLRALELQHNYLTEVDGETLQHLLYLKILVLSENEIEQIPSRVFRGLQHLEWLDLRGNKIRTISSHTFYKAHGINYLNLVDNELASIPEGAFLPLNSYNLWILLNNNSLSELPNDITKMSGVQYLSIAHNDLEYIPPQALIKNRNLRTLDLSYNRITYLHQGTFSGISLQKLDVAGNPWQCDCYLEWLRVYLLTRQVDQTLTCDGPQSLVGTRITQLHQPLLCLEPVIAAPEPEKKILEHQNTSISCLVTGDPPPSVYWYKDGSPLEPQANRYTDVVSSEHLLVFRSVMYTDSGEYACVAVNGREQTNATILLSVMFAPKILNSYKWSPNDADAMSDVTLACDVVANPALNKPITWTKDSRDVSGNEPGMKITRTASGSVLHLNNNPNSDNSGQFQCVASNSLGDATESFRVTRNDMLMLRSSSGVEKQYHYFTTLLVLLLAAMLLT